ncbi:MAG: hypothetical protein GY926_01770 [bacterium]|nr:hypothetical protein [bacterium]MCP4963942.1 hypothetical protein [bacterium]
MTPTFDIEVSEHTPEGRGRLRGLHWMAYRLPDDRTLVDLSGVALVGLVGDTSWNRKTLKVSLDSKKVVRLLPPPPEGRMWQLTPEMWSVSAAPAAMFNRHTAKNAGWAVDEVDTAWDRGVPATQGDLLTNVELFLDLAVSDTDGILHRVSFDFRGVGGLRHVPKPVID